MFLFMIFLIFSLLKQRQRRIRAGQAAPVLPWERPQVTSSAEPDPLDHDVMVVKLLGEEPHRMALPQKVGLLISVGHIGQCLELSNFTELGTVAFVIDEESDSEYSYDNASTSAETGWRLLNFTEDLSSCWF